VVLVDAQASGATIYQHGKSIGKAPQNVKVVPGETLTLVIKARGYKDATVTIDGQKDREIVPMTRVVHTNNNNNDTHTNDTHTNPNNQIKEYCKQHPEDMRCQLEP
jgi:PEGA domain